MMEKIPIKLKRKYYMMGKIKLMGETLMRVK